MSELVGPGISGRVRTRTSERLEFRLIPEQKRAIATAAALLGMDVSDFARTVLTERAEEVLAGHESTTVVPASFFDELVAALDEPAVPSPALERAMARARAIIPADQAGHLGT